MRVSAIKYDTLPLFCKSPDSQTITPISQARIINAEFRIEDTGKNSLHVKPVLIEPVRSDKGLFGGKAGKGRIYCDISLPPLSSNLLVDVGMKMSRMGGILGLVPRWFSMFNPTACSQSELYTAPKSDSTIMLTIRTYF